MVFKGVFFDHKDFTLTDQKIGKGSFGTVYIAENNSNHNQYAAKVIKVKDEIDGNDQVLIMRESTILSRLKHPSIVKFLGVNFRSLKDPSKFQPTIITEYLPNKSLKIILDKEKQSIADPDWSPSKKYICLLGVADAMRYLHDHGILHRDLKPENILMDENYYPRVCDFGLSRCFPGSLNQSMHLSITGQIGTPLYMAPEIINGNDYNSSVDVYAFAILAYEIMTGKEPFYELGKNLNPFLLFKKIESGERPTFKDDVSEKMKNLISRCWDQNPSERPSFKEIFKLLSEDFSYSAESIDEDEINEYLDLLKSNNKTNDKKEDNKVKIEEMNPNFVEILDSLKSELNDIEDLNEFFLFACESGNALFVEYLLSNGMVDVNTLLVSFLMF